MLLEVRRQPSDHACTLGHLYVDGQFECFTLEAPIREVALQAVSTWKVSGKTAIPSGEYAVIVTMSAHFHEPLPLLEHIEGFEGVRIHPGNTACDTEGCILVGRSCGVGVIWESRLAFRPLFAKIQAAITRSEPVTIKITNPPIAVSPDQAIRT
jgi:hypothetical protein